MYTVKISVDSQTEARLDALFSEFETGAWSLQQFNNERTFLQGFFPTAEEAQIAWASLQKKVFLLPTQCTPYAINEEDWKESYKQYLKPWSERNLHWVPLWEKEHYYLPPGHTAVYLDAGMAFGTGAHETTQLCVKRILDFKEKQGASFCQKSIMDAGCGSGILAISAAKLGCSNVIAFDIDPDAIQVSKENRAENSLSAENISFALADIQAGLRDNNADLILANIQADVLCLNAKQILTALQPKAEISMSGILKTELKCVSTS